MLLASQQQQTVELSIVRAGMALRKSNDERARLIYFYLRMAQFYLHYDGLLNLSWVPKWQQMK